VSEVGLTAAEELARIQLAKLRAEKEWADYEASMKMRLERTDSNGDPLDGYGPRPQLDESRSYYVKPTLSPDELEAKLDEAHKELSDEYTEVDGEYVEVQRDVEALPDHVRERAHRELYGDRADQVESNVKPSRVTTIQDPDGRNRMKVESFGDSYMRYSLEDEP